MSEEDGSSVDTTETAGEPLRISDKLGVSYELRPGEPEISPSGLEHTRWNAVDSQGHEVGSVKFYVKEVGPDDNRQKAGGIADIGVGKQHRERGIAKAILQQVEEKMRRDGVQSVSAFAAADSVPLFVGNGYQSMYGEQLTELRLPGPYSKRLQ